MKELANRTGFSNVNELIVFAMGVTEEPTAGGMQKVKHAAVARKLVHFKCPFIG